MIAEGGLHVGDLMRGIQSVVYERERARFITPPTVLAGRILLADFVH